MEKRHYFAVLSILIAVDQGSKLLVVSFLQNNRLFLLGDFLKLKIVRNDSSMALLSEIGTVPPPIFAVFVKLAVLLLALWLIFYLGKTYGKGRAWKAALTAIPAGIICAVLDSAVWKSTVDFIDIASTFAIDLKDIYLDIGCLCLIVYAVGKKIWVSPKKSPSSPHGTD